jgi:hypothetical protein
MGTVALALLFLQDLQNDRIRATFDNGRLVAIDNVKSGETYKLDSTEFDIDTLHGRLRSKDARKIENGRYTFDAADVTVRYTLVAHYIRKNVTIQFREPSGVRTVKLLDLKPGLKGRVHKSYHCFYYFGESERGGLMAGIECPFTKTDDTGAASYTPNLKAEKTFECESAYIGVYVAGKDYEAMSELVSTELDRPRRAFWQAFNGWSAQTFRLDLTDPGWPKAKAYDFDTIKLCAEAGIDLWTSAATWVGDYKAFGREALKLNPEREALIEEMRRRNVGLFHWLSPNNVNPWMGDRRYRLDKPEWALYRKKDKPELNSNCCGSAEFIDWLSKRTIEDLHRTKAQGFITDGDLSGGPGSVGGNIGFPVVCHATNHAHLDADATYASWKGIMELFRRVRAEFPDMILTACRPQMDLGAWSWRYMDVIFTVDEFPKPKKILGSLSLGVCMGEDTRKRAYTRRHRDFCPYWMDSQLLYPIHYTNNPSSAIWDRYGHEYGLLSAMAVCDSVTGVMFPPRDRLVPEDLALLKKWADWARANAKDFGPVVEMNLPNVDGYSRGSLIFLFNPSLRTQEVKLDGNLEEIHPLEGHAIADGKVRVLPHTAMILRRVSEKSKTLRGYEGETVGGVTFAGHFPELSEWKRNGSTFEATLPVTAKPNVAPSAEKSRREPFSWADPNRVLLSIPITDFGRKDPPPVVRVNGREVPVRVTSKDMSPCPYADLTDALVEGHVNTITITLKDHPPEAFVGPALFNLRPRATEKVGKSAPLPMAPEEY